MAMSNLPVDPRFLPWIGGLVFLVLQAPAHGQGAEAGRAHHDRDASRAGTGSVPTALVGRVLGPDGEPVQGAVVVTSAGGQAVTDARGAYRLAVEMPLDACHPGDRCRSGTRRELGRAQVALTGASTTPTRP